MNTIDHYSELFLLFLHNMEKKLVPGIAATVQEHSQPEPPSPPGPPLPPTGLPEGWTMEQWGHYGHQYMQSMSDKQNQ